MGSKLKQREIKFRVWDNYYEVMEYIDFYWFEENGVYDSDGDGYHSDYNIMQYIGIKDKDGVKIYEGDKVIVPWDMQEIVEGRV